MNKFEEVAMVGPSLAESDTRCLHTCNLLDAEQSHVADASPARPQPRPLCRYQLDGSICIIMNNNNHWLPRRPHGNMK